MPFYISAINPGNRWRIEETLLSCQGLICSCWIFFLCTMKQTHSCFSPSQLKWSYDFHYTPLLSFSIEQLALADKDVFVAQLHLLSHWDDSVLFVLLLLPCGKMSQMSVCFLHEHHSASHDSLSAILSTPNLCSWLCRGLRLSSFWCAAAHASGCVRFLHPCRWPLRVPAWD